MAVSQQNRIKATQPISVTPRDCLGVESLAAINQDVARAPVWMFASHHCRRIQAHVARKRVRHCAVTDVARDGFSSQAVDGRNAAGRSSAEKDDIFDYSTADW